MTLPEFFFSYVVAFVSNPDYVKILVLSLVLLVYLRHLTKQKVFYFIRHGQTLLNHAHIKQGSEGALSEEGLAEAQAIAHAFDELTIQIIYTSPYERAVQTATIIGTAIHARVVQVPLLAERRNPTEVIGKSTSDPQTMRITELIERSFHDDTYRFSDEENFSDLHLRAKKCMRLLRNQPKDKVCVVTHHAFLQVLISTLLYQDTLTAQDYVKLAFYNYSSTGGITTCIYRPLQRFFTASKGWEVVGYNQTAQS